MVPLGPDGDAAAAAAATHRGVAAGVDRVGVMIPSDEVTRLLRRIQALTLEVAEHEAQKTGGRELEAKKLALEQLRRRLAGASRRVAHDDLGNAA